MKPKEIVVVGGGTGTYTVLRGLKRYQKQVNLSAVVTMADSGGSTGRLRDEFGYLPVGDVRMALVALSHDGDEHEALLRKLFLYRFLKGQGLTGHNFGNLFLTALRDILGSEDAAIAAAARVLRVEGKVIPVTTDKVDLIATYTDGTVKIGEHFIDEPERGAATAPITNLSLTQAATISPLAKRALLEADLIVLGPGDLYTSVLANCVVTGVKEAIAHSGAKVVYVSNLMTKVGQTSGMGLKEHLAELSKYLVRPPDCVLFNTAVLPDYLLSRYAKDGEYPVCFNYEADVVRVIPAPLLASGEIKTSAGDALKRSLIRHDSTLLARQLLALL
jgi:uncharacterized cofD-like protein